MLLQKQTYFRKPGCWTSKMATDIHHWEEEIKKKKKSDDWSQES